MDVAALNLSIKSDDVVVATAALDKFTASADRAGAAGAKLSGGGGNTAKLAADYARAAQMAAQAAGNIQRLETATNQAATAQQSAAAVAARAGGAYQQADAQVIAYRNHLLGLVTASQQVAAGQAGLSGQVGRVGTTALQANAHVLAYQANLQRLAAASAAAGAASARAAGGIAAVGIAARVSGALAGAFASILGGLIGVIIGTVITALIEMVSKLWDSDAAMKEVTAASDNLGAAQNVLGEMFDLSTGKIKNNTAAIRDNIYMQAVAFEAAAVKAKTDAATALSESGVGRTTGMERAWARLKGFSGGVFGGLAAEQGIAQREAQGRQFESLGEGLAQGGLSREEAGKMLERQRKTLSQKEYFALQDFLNRSYEQQTAATGARDLRAVLDGAELPSRYLKPDSGSGRKARERSGRGGGKTEAEKIADLVRNAQAEIAIEQNRTKAVEMSAQAAADLEQKTKLLNAAASAGLKLTPALTDQIEKLATAYATAKVDADMAEVVKGTTDEIQKQRDAIADEIKLIGLRGDGLARARREAEADKKLRDSLPKGAIYVGGNLTGGLSDDIEARDRASRMADVRKDAEDAAYAMDLERRGLELTGAAAIEYAYISERLLEARRAGIELSPAEVAAINAAGEAYANQRYEVDQLAEGLALQREVAGGFFRDFLDGAQNGTNAIKAFGDAAVNALNRIIEKMLDKAIDKFLNLGSGGSGGGFFDKLLNFGVSALTSSAGAPPGSAGGMDLRGFANGGAFDRTQRFAKGGAFTNQIVNSPTLFRFANGAALGEMGEAGPEAIMPLKRGPNGALGVQSTGGGKPSVRMGDVYMEIKLEGAMMPETVVAIAQQAGQQAISAIRRDFANIAAEYETNGVVAA